MLIDSHCHVIATDTKRYPLKPLFGKQSDWSAEHPLDYPDMVKAAKEFGVDKSILVPLFAMAMMVHVHKRLSAKLLAARQGTAGGLTATSRPPLQRSS